MNTSLKKLRDRKKWPTLLAGGVFGSRLRKMSYCPICWHDYESDKAITAKEAREYKKKIKPYEKI